MKHPISILLLLGLVAGILAGCAVAQHKGPFGMTILLVRDSRQDGYNSACQHLMDPSGKILHSNCANGPSLLQSAISGSTQGALGAYLLRPDNFENTNTNKLNNEQYQGQKQSQHQNQSQYQNVNPPMPGMD